MSFYKHRYWRPVERMTHQPAAVQAAVLRRLMEENRHTRFGIEHGFADICDHAKLQLHLPVQDYESLRPYMDEQRLTGVRALTAESPLFYAQTSGTTGKPKYIPITPATLAMHRDEQSLFSYLQYRVCPQAFMGKALGIMGAAVEGRLDSGHAVGAVSGHLYQSLPGMIQSRFVLPPAVSSIADYDLKYLVMLRLALAEPNITYAGSPNPSTFLRLLDMLHERREVLIKSLATGRLAELDVLDAPLRASLVPRLRPDPARAAQIDALSELTFANVWPSLQLVTTWTGGSCGIALASLRSKLPAAATVMELGYQSSEFRGSIALHGETPGGLPPLHHHFFEFVEQARWGNGNAEFLTLDRLDPGKLYYVIVTTAAGLYRYFMNDLVEVTGFFNATPLLRFAQKGKGVTSITGEKLYEAQVIQAVQGISAENGLVSSFFVLVADEEALAYRLFMEVDTKHPKDAASVAAMIDARLGELNMEYQAKRSSGRLAPLCVVWLGRGATEAYKAACIRSGQREGQFKAAALQYRKELPLALEDYRIR